MNPIKCLPLLITALFLFASCNAADTAQKPPSADAAYELPIVELIINEPLWFDRFTRDEVWQMVENSDEMIQRVLGASVDLHCVDSLLIGNRYVVASGTANIPIWNDIIARDADIFFLPQTINNDTSNIALRIAAYDIEGHTGLTMNRLTARFNLDSFFKPDEDTITVRFSLARDEGRPIFYYYAEEELSRDTTIDEINRLMRLHTGQQVMDTWFCRDVCHWWIHAENWDTYSCPNPSKLYINLYPVDLPFFDWGSTGSYIRGHQLVGTFFSFPGVEEIEVLVNGSAGAATSHFSFEHVFSRDDWLERSTRDY